MTLTCDASSWLPVETLTNAAARLTGRLRSVCAGLTVCTLPDKLRPHRAAARPGPADQHPAGCVRLRRGGPEGHRDHRAGGGADPGLRRAGGADAADHPAP